MDLDSGKSIVVDVPMLEPLSAAMTHSDLSIIADSVNGHEIILNCKETVERPEVGKLQILMRSIESLPPSQRLDPQLLRDYMPMPMRIHHQWHQRLPIHEPLIGTEMIDPRSNWDKHLAFSPRDGNGACG